MNDNENKFKSEVNTLNQDKQVTIHHDDCLTALRAMPDASVSAIVTDPPYGLSKTDPASVADTITKWATGDREHVPTGRGFMGKSWDSFVPARLEDSQALVPHSRRAHGGVRRVPHPGPHGLVHPPGGV